MASLRSSQGILVLLIAMLVCQALLVPSLARTQVAVETQKLASPQETVSAQGSGEYGHGHGDKGGHGHGGHGDKGGHKHEGHGDKGGHKHGGHGDKGGHGHGGHGDKGHGGDHKGGHP